MVAHRWPDDGIAQQIRIDIEKVELELPVPADVVGHVTEVQVGVHRLAIRSDEVAHRLKPGNLRRATISRVPDHPEPQWAG